MNTHRLRRIIRFALTEGFKSMEEQTFSDHRGEWRVTDIVRYANEHGAPQVFDVADLADIAFEPGEHETGDELPGSPEYVERAMATDLKWPIIVVRYDDGDFIADGNHRLWKAHSMGIEKIRGILIDESELDCIPRM